MERQLPKMTTFIICCLVSKYSHHSTVTLMHGFSFTALSNGAYERFCVLFNIGALLSQIASSQNHTSDDGLKTSAKYYQQSAGIFAYLKDNIYPVLQTLPTPDLAVSCLSTLSAIMVAQAQECIYTKASTGELSKIFIIDLSC